MLRSDEEGSLDRNARAAPREEELVRVDIEAAA
jgi:hypothetical protein